MIAFISTSYDKPKTRKGRLIYIPFPLAWIFLSISVYLGQIISRRYLAAVMSAPNQEVFNKILGNVNNEFLWQLRWMLRVPIAEAIGAVPPFNRPHYLDEYQQDFKISDEDFAQLAVKLFSQNGDSFAMVRADAKKEYNISINDLTGEWGLEVGNKETGDK